MKRSLCILLFLFLVSVIPSRADNSALKRISSLRDSIAREKNDSARLAEIFSINGMFVLQGNRDSILRYFNLAWKICDTRYRHSGMDDAEREKWAGKLTQLCRQYRISLYTLQGGVKLIENKFDSLIHVFGSEKREGEVAELQTDLADFLLGQARFDESEKQCGLAMEYWKRTVNKEGQLRVLGLLASNEQGKSNFPTALHYVLEKIQVSSQLSDTASMWGAYHLAGNLYSKMNNYHVAIDYFNRSLALKKKFRWNNDSVNYYNAVASEFINLGLAYGNLGDTALAFSYHREALRLVRKVNNWHYETMEMNNMAIIYLPLKIFPPAVDLLKEALKIRAENHDSDAVTWYLNALGDAYVQWHKSDSAIACFLKALYVNQRVGNQAYFLRTYSGLLSAYTMNGKFEQAERYGALSLQCARASNSLGQLSEVYHLLSEMDRAKGDFRNAYEYYKKYSELQDSISNDDKSKEIGRLEAQSEFDKQQAISEAEHKKEIEKQQAISESETKRKNVIIGSVAAGLLLVCAFAMFIFNRLRVTRRQKTIIEKQKQEVEDQKVLIEDKNKEITDSINYAKRIQQSLLPSDKFIERSLRRTKRK